ncbi:hypothetical protein EJ08DRAFT_694030 [Tothia fuscella]|uniref:Uncharacterized protein n=1 Tax=Tothia fuscella TaxID=1048955 RepID=A0A9P4U1M3_9PEZI|nr:hypothetical protein EJ08DRAFT_694030 [Tothia fuscella]
MAKTLAAITRSYESILVDIQAQGEDLEAFELSVLDYIHTKSSEPALLFRAQKHPRASKPSFAPAIAVPFDFDFKRTSPIHIIAILLAEHLTKTQTESKTGRKVKTCFMSISPILEWTLHTTAQKSKEIKEEEVAGLAIFDVKKLKQAPNTIVFRVSDFLDFMTSEGRDNYISKEVYRWVQNCDKYVAIGKKFDSSMVGWITWQELSHPSASILSPDFKKAFTLKLYRKWVQEQHIRLDLLCQNIVAFGKLLAGPQDELVPSLLESILKPGIQFWGYRIDSDNDIVTRKIFELYDELGTEKLSGR